MKSAIDQVMKKAAISGEFLKNIPGFCRRNIKKNSTGFNMDSERIPRSLLRGLASELQSMDIFLAWKIPCTLVQGASM